MGLLGLFRLRYRNTKGDENMSGDFGFDDSKTLNELRDEALRIAREHGFIDATVGEDLMLMVSELAEALEDYRSGLAVDIMRYRVNGITVDGKSSSTIPFNDDGSPRKPIGIPSEMADVIIRVLHFCGKHNIDIEQAVKEKMAFNNSRTFKHGKKL